MVSQTIVLNERDAGSSHRSCLKNGRFGGNWVFDVLKKTSRKLRPENEVSMTEMTTACKLKGLIVFANWRTRKLVSFVVRLESLGKLNDCQIRVDFNQRRRLTSRLKNYALRTET
jgi:hypothetical protein